MIGLVHKLLANCITESYGSAMWTNILENAGLDKSRTFRLDTIYDDVEWRKLFNTCYETLGLSEENAYKIFARYFFQDTLKRFPTFYQMSKNSYEFLIKQPKIHNSFYSGAANEGQAYDKFRLKQVNEKKLITYYHSSNKHCMLYKALATLVIDHYHDEATITETQCMCNGDDLCEIHIDWAKLNRDQDGTSD